MKSNAFDTLHKLLYNKNNTRPKIDPWGTLHLMYLEKELYPLHSSEQTEFYNTDNSWSTVM